MDIFGLLNSPKPDSSPMRKFKINGQVYNCLCDSGACTTVVTTLPPGAQSSNKRVWVKSASGHVTALFYTKPLKLLDVETNTCVKAQILVDPSCPVNLLGRDMLTAFDITIKPTPDGKMTTEIGPRDPAKSLVVLGEGGPPNYWWSLDLTDKEESNNLIRTAKEELQNMGVTTKIRTMRPDELHCTLRYKQVPGPDPDYDEEVHKLPEHGSIVLSHILVGESGQSCAAVTLNPKQQLANRCPFSHVSLTTSLHDDWQKMYILVRAANQDRFDGPDVDGWYTGRNSKIRKKNLGLYVPATPAIHLDES